MIFDELTPKEKKQMQAYLGFFSAFVIEPHLQQMFAFGVGMLIRPLASKMTKLIERK